MFLSRTEFHFLSQTFGGVVHNATKQMIAIRWLLYRPDICWFYAQCHETDENDWMTLSFADDVRPRVLSFEASRLALIG